jgi:3-dehydroquinate synthase
LETKSPSLNTVKKLIGGKERKNMKKVTVKLLNNSYDILISNDEKNFINLLKKIKEINTFFIITDKNVAGIYLKYLLELLKKENFNVKFVVIKAGENSKSIEMLSFLYNRALKEGLDRKSCVLAFGGGVIGDLAGFFASTYMRGIKLIQIPTTLLAMTDSSVGGKTAITTSGAKNIAGTFKQPNLVWINSDFLNALPRKEIRNGFAEVIKYSLTFDKKFFDWLLLSFKKVILFRERFDFDQIIYKCCAYKAEVVGKDEKDIKGIREALNFGHTLAHSIETYTGYKKFLHGEAVGIGMLFAAQLSAACGLADKKLYEEVRNILSFANLIFDIRGFEAAKLLALMKKDKKSYGGEIRFVLLKDIGKVVCGYIVDDKIVLKELKKFIGNIVDRNEIMLKELKEFMEVNRRKK